MIFLVTRFPIRRTVYLFLSKHAEAAAFTGWLRQLCSNADFSTVTPLLYYSVAVEVVDVR